MKPTILLSLCFFLFALTPYLFPLAFSQDPEQVKDAYGNPLVPGRRYSIVPALRGSRSGGVSPDKTGNQTCPLTVVQEYFECRDGKPVIFSVSGITPGTGTILTGTHLDIAFVEKPECADTSKWVVVGNLTDYPGAPVSIGGVEDHPGQHILDGTFNIQKLDCGGYKLVFCSIENRCVHIRTYSKRSQMCLIASQSGTPFQVVFIAAGGGNGVRSTV
ncbi:kunitz-type serine protease inhibitor DrTI-like [Lotus japonicus]|uniref:kunitz-type serine protease inhibitor DrTI-like n=1 Tax=Lotus japonicus TaxID=34305 RepID=UPI0025871A2F|nr:kunitz-type serine protease inhibitor DrTI-like [Lotus japonicus]